MRCPDLEAMEAFVRGAESGDLQAHLDRCSHCRSIALALQQKSDPTVLDKPARRSAPQRTTVLAPGNHVGRYVIVELRGAGGMGAVYAAYDPKLDRKVAVKVLRPGVIDGSTGRVRLEREAQALARLSHPNVVAVHDVGEHEDGVFIAMELIDGETLSGWLRAERRSWRAIVDVCVDVARGLAAAHAVGLVHRDVKPGNVLVGVDGRVRVTDFGLALAGIGGGDIASSRLSTAPSLTASGVVAGTPSYMAPEQFEGKPVDARTDQFAFCIALYEALYGERPFAGATVNELGKAVTSGKMQPLPQGRRVPARILRCIRRGLSVDPADRYPSMTALIADLRRDRSRVVTAVAASAVVAAAIGGVWLARHDATPRATCDGGAAKRAAVWSEPRKLAVRAAFARTNRPFAAETYDAVAQTLDRYTQDWSVMHRETCEATLRGEQSSELRDLRMHCLASRLDEVRAFTDLLLDADAQMLGRAANAARTLPPLRECGEAQLLSAIAPPPSTPLVDEIEHQLARARGFAAAGRDADAKRTAEEILPRARELGYAPLEAKLQGVIGTAQIGLGDLAAAEDALEAGIRAAERGRDDHTRAVLLTRLSFLVGVERSNGKRGLEIADQADAVIARMGGDPAAEARLESNRGAILSTAGQFDEAIEHYERSRARWRKVPDAKSLDAMTPVSNLALTLHYSGRDEEAVALDLEAEAMVIEVAGPGHPESARLMMNRGIALVGLRRFAEAHEVLDAARTLYEQVYGVDSWQAAQCQLAIGDLENAEGKFDAAITHARRALDTFTKHYGEDDLRVEFALYALATAQANAGQVKEAHKVIERAIAIARRVLPPGHPALLASLQLRATLDIELRSFADAQAALDEARPFVLADHREEERGRFELVEAWLDLERRDPAKAIAPLEHAVTALDKPITRWEAQVARFLLGRALWESKRDRARVHELVVAARRGMRELGDTFPRDVARVDAWLAAR